MANILDAIREGAPEVGGGLNLGSLFSFLLSPKYRKDLEGRQEWRRFQQQAGFRALIAQTKGREAEARSAQTSADVGAYDFSRGQDVNRLLDQGGVPHEVSAMRTKQAMAQQLLEGTRDEQAQRSAMFPSQLRSAQAGVQTQEAQATNMERALRSAEAVNELFRQQHGMPLDVMLPYLQGKEALALPGQAQQKQATSMFQSPNFPYVKPDIQSQIYERMGLKPPEQGTSPAMQAEKIKYIMDQMKTQGGGQVPTSQAPVQGGGSRATRQAPPGTVQNIQSALSNILSETPPFQSAGEAAASFEQYIAGLLESGKIRIEELRQMIEQLAQPEQ